MFNEYKKKLPGQDAISAREYNLTQRVIRNLMKSMGVNSVMCGSGLHFRRSGGAADSSMVPAKAQEVSQTDGILSVKLLDSNQEETGEAFDVYAFPDKAITGDAANMKRFIPRFAIGDSLWVHKYNNDWYIVGNFSEVGLF